MSFYSINPRRTYLVAKRDFVGYIKTWGFWLTALGPLMGMVVGGIIMGLMMKSEPTRYVSILDETGQHGSEIIRLQTERNNDTMTELLRGLSKYTVARDDKAAFETLLTEQGPEAAKDFIRKNNPKIGKFINMPESKLQFVDLPALDMESLNPYLLGDKTINVKGEEQKLAGVLHIVLEGGEDGKDGKTVLKYWTIHPSGTNMKGLTDRYFRNFAAQEYLSAQGLTLDGYLDHRNQSLRVSTFNPEKTADGKGGQKVSRIDLIPYIVAAALAAILWFAVFTGAYMLLMSMVEEKINKVLEMLLATTRFSEIFVGKLIGIAALTLASFLPWIIMGGIGFIAMLQLAPPEMVEALSQAITFKMMIFLVIFFILGYVFYGSMFIAMGAMAESMQDASTMMTPLVLMLTGCIMVVPVGISFPDSPLLSAAQWFPFSAPFAAIIRLPSDPPLWETLGSMLVLIVSSALVVWLSARMFKHGVLTGGGMAGVKAWFSRVILRRKNV